jgi:hypothetical protein
MRVIGEGPRVVVVSGSARRKSHDPDVQVLLDLPEEDEADDENDEGDDADD